MTGPFWQNLLIFANIFAIKLEATISGQVKFDILTLSDPEMTLLWRSACKDQQAKIDEAMADAKKLKWGYFAELKFIGAKESDERRVEAEKTMQEVHDLRFQERIHGRYWCWYIHVFFNYFELALRLVTDNQKPHC